jgi:hypothetical protein
LVVVVAVVVVLIPDFQFDGFIFRLGINIKQAFSP